MAWFEPQDSVQLPYKWLNSMVYGRYNELVNGGFKWFINQLITGGPSSGNMMENSCEIMRMTT